MTEKQLAIAAGAAGLGLMAYAADKAWHLRKDFSTSPPCTLWLIV